MRAPPICRKRRSAERASGIASVASERGEGEDRQSEDEPTPAGTQATRIDAAEHGRYEVGSLGDVERAPERHELLLELSHLATSSRSRSSARAVLDFTVPRRTPSASAVSCSESSRK